VHSSLPILFLYNGDEYGLSFLSQDILSLLNEGDAIAFSGSTVEQKLNNTNLTAVDLQSYCGSNFNETAFIAVLKNSIFPNITLPDVFYNTSTVANDTITNYIATSFDTIREYMSRFDITDVRKHLVFAMDQIDSANGALHKVRNGEWAVKLYGCLLIVIVCTLIVVALMHLFTRTSRPVRPFLFWFIIPIFIMFVIFSWAIAMLISAAAIVNSGMSKKNDISYVWTFITLIQVDRFVFTLVLVLALYRLLFWRAHEVSGEFRCRYDETKRYKRKSITV